MILGFGIDLCDIRRIEQALTRFGDRFANRCFTEIERRKSEGRANSASSYAKRFAAKEACAKALGTGIAAGVAWRDMGVVNLASGKPALCLTGGAALRLAEMTPGGHIAVIHLTLTDEYPMAQAQVIIEAIAGEPVTMEKPKSLPTASQSLPAATKPLPAATKPLPTSPQSVSPSSPVEL